MKLLVLLAALCILSPLPALSVDESTIFDHPATVDDADVQATYAQVSYDGPWVAAFTQTKQIHQVARSFRSTGRMLLQPGEGIAWVIEKPYPSTMVVGSSSIVQSLPGQAPSRLDFGDNQTFTQISRTIVMVLSGDLSSVADAFTLYFAKEGGEWMLALKPRQQEMAAFVDAFILSGSTELESVVMEETSGDSVRYTFSSIERRSLTDDEIAVFSL